MRPTLFEVDPARLARLAAAEIKARGEEDRLIGVDLAGPGEQVWEPVLSRLVAAQSQGFQFRYLKLSRDVGGGGESTEALLWHQVFIWALYHELAMDEHLPL